MSELYRFSAPSPRELVELSAIMRALSLGHKAAGATLRGLAERYEISAVSAQLEASRG